MRKANYNVHNIVNRLADFHMNYLVGGRHGSLDKLYGPNSNSCSAETMNTFLTGYFYGLLAWSVYGTENDNAIDKFKKLNSNAIRALVEDLCIEYSPELPIPGTGGVISGTLRGGKKRTRKKKKKRHRHKKTYSRRRKTKKRKSRKKRNRKRNRK